MQVIATDVRDLHQLLEIQKPEPAPVHGNQTLVAEIMKHAVDVYGRQAERIGKVCLRHWQSNFVALAQPNRFQPPNQFAEEACDPSMSVAPPQRYQMLTLHRQLLQIAPPQDL